MLTRRSLARASLLFPALAAVAQPRIARAQTAAQAVAFVNTTAKDLIAVIDSTASQADKQGRLQQIVDRAVAVEQIARFCLGRFWRTATAAQQQDYVKLFHHVLLASITGHLGEYKGVTYTLGRPVPGEGGIEVPSVLNRPGAASAKLTWVVNDIGGQPKVIDVVAEGTSMRVTQRSDYDSYLNQHGGSVEALIGALKRQAARAG